MNRKITLLGVLLILQSLTLLFAQSLQVTGKVLSKSDNLPLEGASVVVKGTTTGTVTDRWGNFSLNVPQRGSVIVVTYTGMVDE